MSRPPPLSLLWRWGCGVHWGEAGSGEPVGVPGSELRIDPRASSSERDPSWPG